MERDGKEKEGAKERKRKGRREFAPIDIKKSQRLCPSRLFIRLLRNYNGSRILRSIRCGLLLPL